MTNLLWRPIPAETAGVEKAVFPSIASIRSLLRRAYRRVIYWVTNDERYYGDNERQGEKVDVFRLVPFILIHTGCLGVFFVGVSTFAIALACTLYFARMFFITAFYHRYFSHRTYEVPRFVQALMAILGCTAGQRGPLWWASHHRSHHLHSDTVEDPHSPNQNGFWFSHTLWFLTPKAYSASERHIKDWLRYPELKWIDRTDSLPFIGLGIACYALGTLAQQNSPQLGTSGLQLLVWGFFVSTTCLYHATFTINSVAHLVGTRRFKTRDNSRNNPILALITLGEGWHNNHHRYPCSAKQGFYWWEFDIAYFGIWLMSIFGLVKNIQRVPASILSSNRNVS